MSRKMRAFTILTLVCASVLAHGADDFDLKVANIDVLQDKNVQADMGITQGQRKTLNLYAEKLNATNKAKILEYQKANKKPDQAFVDYGRKQYIQLRTSVLKALSPNQIKRLRELTLRAAGPRALLDKAVADKVGMPTKDFSTFCAAIREGDQKIAKIKSDVSDKIRAKYKDQKQPKTQKEGDALQAKLNADLAAEMKKHESEMKTVLQTSEAKTSKIVTKKYLDTLVVLMGKPLQKQSPPKKLGK